MGLRINTNIDIATAGAPRRAASTAGRGWRLLDRLSAGLRVSSVADDALGLAISERLRLQVRWLGEAALGQRDGGTFVAAAERALGEVDGILARLRQSTGGQSTGGASAPAVGETAGPLRSSADSGRDEPGGLPASVGAWGAAHDVSLITESRISDDAAAYRIAEQSRDAIKRQAPVSILSQANARLQSALPLLQ